MASRSKPKAKKKPVKANPRQASRGRVAKAPRKPGKGHNSGDYAVPDEVIGRNLDALKAKKKALDKVVADYKEDLDQARGVYRSARKLAKKEGVNLKAFDIMVSLEADDMGHVQVNYADVARYQKITDSPLLQLDMFSNMLAPEPEVDVALQGLNAGKAAEPESNNPWPPGSEKYVLWADNHKLGIEQTKQGFSKQ